jgi:hypothetical protein
LLLLLLLLAAAAAAPTTPEDTLPAAGVASAERTDNTSETRTF